MLRLAAIALIITLAAVIPVQAANTAVERMIEEKRRKATADRLEALQKIQHRQSNPQAYLASKYSKSEDKISFSAARDGHYYVPVELDGRTVNFLADTGATSIFISQGDARKLGINVDNLNYNRRYQTANGAIGNAAVATVRRIKVGPIELSDVPVTVSGEKTHMALLGMEFFRRVSKYSVENGSLTIYK